MTRDLHTHTVFSDGENTPREMIEAALAKGMEAIGISDHAYTAFDESYCMPKARIGEYRREITALKEEYRGRIDVFLGIEQDYWSEEAVDGYDYVIGSVHYVRCGDAYIPVDENAEILQDAIARYFGGDPYALVEAYFKTVGDVVKKTHADLIGHFDLIRKYNAEGKFFDEAHPRYRAAAKKAIDKLLRTGVPFESNVGGMMRGYVTTPYPATEWEAYLLQNGGRLIPTTDSHTTQTVGEEKA